MGALRAQEAQPLRPGACDRRSEEHTSELQSPDHLVCRLLLQSHGATRALHSFPTRRSSDLGRRGLERRRNRAGNADLGPAVRGGGPAHLAGGTARVAMIRRAWARFARKKRNLFGLGLAIALALLAIFADFVASSRPIVLRRGGRLYVFANVIDYRDLR